MARQATWPPLPPPPETLGFSPISTTETPEAPPRTNRKRKGKQPWLRMTVYEPDRGRK
ncbi:hypothetical protein BDZ91DRAFT_717578 [Kalaharituber pfeilii]|nr:hypothetical protein BDZ91DRAFT_717578 [Kalaharituber pfeilii]